MKHADLAGQLMSVMEDIEAGIASLRHWMTFDGIEQCRVFRLPDVPAGAEEIEPERIDPVPVDGDEAIDLALAALGKFGTGDGLSTRCVYRLPGALSVSTADPQRLLDQVDSINKLKSVFDAIGQRIT